MERKFEIFCWEGKDKRSIFLCMFPDFTNILKRKIDALSVARSEYEFLWGWRMIGQYWYEANNLIRERVNPWSHLLPNVLGAEICKFLDLPSLSSATLASKCWLRSASQIMPQPCLQLSSLKVTATHSDDARSWTDGEIVEEKGGHFYVAVPDAKDDFSGVCGAIYDVEDKYVLCIVYDDGIWEGKVDYALFQVSSDKKLHLLHKLKSPTLNDEDEDYQVVLMDWQVVENERVWMLFEGNVCWCMELGSSEVKHQLFLDSDKNSKFKDPIKIQVNEVQNSILFVFRTNKSIHFRKFYYDPRLPVQRFLLDNLVPDHSVNIFKYTSTCLWSSSHIADKIWVWQLRDHHTHRLSCFDTRNYQLLSIDEWQYPLTSLGRFYWCRETKSWCFFNRMRTAGFSVLENKRTLQVKSKRKF